MATVSQVRQNFHVDSENGINRQINKHLNASYVYQSIAFYFDRDDVALAGISHYFKEASEEEREHAEKLLKYQNKRGGRIVLADINAPPKSDWGTAVDAFTVALQLQKDVNQGLLDLHRVASSHNDPELSNYVESEFLQEEVNKIKRIGDLLTNARRVGEGLGVFVFDKELKS